MSQVSLHIYDLSNGLAKALSKPLTGQDFEAVYHTGVVVNNTEYFYGDGISTGYPGQTPYGVPKERREMGSTTKTMTEIQQFISSQQQDFSAMTYNPMTHNCNHFSKAFLVFLGLSNFPEEILAQPEQFLGTPIGQMIFGSMSGFSAPKDQKPAPKRLDEEINESYTTLYIQEPKVFIADEGVIIENIRALAAVANFGNFENYANTILNSALDKKDLEMNKDFCESLNNIKSFADKTVLFNVLAAVVLTSNVNGMPEAVQPLAYLDSALQLNDQSAEAYLRYINNWFTQIPGMRDGRKHAIEYTTVVHHYMNHQNSSLVIAACRTFYAESRFLLLDNIKQTSPVPFLMATIDKFHNLYTQTAKPWTAALNLCCGSLGRVLLTLQQLDVPAYNFMRVSAQRDLQSLGKLKDVNAPCCKDLAQFLAKAELNKDDDGCF